MSVGTARLSLYVGDSEKVHMCTLVRCLSGIGSTATCAPTFVTNNLVNGLTGKDKYAEPRGNIGC